MGRNGETYVFRVSWTDDRIVATTIVAGIRGVTIGHVADGAVSWLQSATEQGTSWVKFYYDAQRLPSVAIQRTSLSPERTVFRCLRDGDGGIQRIVSQVWSLRGGEMRRQARERLRYVRENAHKLVKPAMTDSLVEAVHRAAAQGLHAGSLLFVLDPEEPAFTFPLHRLAGAVVDPQDVARQIRNHDTHVLEPELPLTASELEELNVAQGAHEESLRIARRVMRRAAASLYPPRRLGVTDVEGGHLRWY